ncbi:unnamed protein product [Phytomonas sp. Hart1]|nr:unnamed protein product [Phytomonas sp. Hart1]|eukprot:CCW66719.1 unnamed protein product [Phytomonas sp. isolate Hart1]
MTETGVESSIPKSQSVVSSLQNNVNHSNKEKSESISRNCVYSCRLCRKVLFHEIDLLRHLPKAGEAGRHPFQRQRVADHSGVEEDVVCTSYFVDPDVTTWVTKESRDAMTSGEAVAPDTLYCPNPACRVKLGTQSWTGTQCSCGVWVTPAFKVLGKCVDRLVMGA